MKAEPTKDNRAVHRLGADAQGLRFQQARYLPPPVKKRPGRWRHRPKVQLWLF